MSVAVPQRNMRTSGSRATQGCSARTSSASRQAAASSRSARPYCRRWSSSAKRTAAPRIGVTSSGLLAFHATPYSSTPSATAVVATVGRWRRRPITRAARASTSVVRLSAAPSGITEDAGAQEQREERQRSGDAPHQRREPGDRDAEHQRSLAAFGGTADGGAEPGGPEEHGDSDHCERGDDRARSDRWPTG